MLARTNLFLFKSQPSGPTPVKPSRPTRSQEDQQDQGQHHHQSGAWPEASFGNAHNISEVLLVVTYEAQVEEEMQLESQTGL